MSRRGAVIATIVIVLLVGFAAPHIRVLLSGRIEMWFANGISVYGVHTGTRNASWFFRMSFVAPADSERASGNPRWCVRLNNRDIGLSNVTADDLRRIGGTRLSTDPDCWVFQLKDADDIPEYDFEFMFLNGRLSQVVLTATPSDASRQIPLSFGEPKRTLMFPCNGQDVQEVLGAPVNVKYYRGRG